MTDSLTKTWSSEQWQQVRELRSLFLESTTGTVLTEDYWKTDELLELYDQSLARRILWKWQHFLKDLSHAPADLDFDAPASILDFGCGSGVSAEAWLEAGVGRGHQWTPWDRSMRARAFTAKKWKSLGLNVEEISREKDLFSKRWDWVVLSHVATELPKNVWDQLLLVLAQAKAVFWVDAGTPVVSRQLGEIREKLIREGFTTLGPCTHNRPCPLLKTAVDGMWCHHFAPTPSEVSHDPFFSRLRTELQIDFRSLPYSCLAMVRKNRIPDPQWDRILGRPRQYKGHVRLHSCHGHQGVRELRISHRLMKPLAKRLVDVSGPRVVQWSFDDNDQVIEGEALE